MAQEGRSCPTQGAARPRTRTHRNDPWTAPDVFSVTPRHGCPRPRVSSWRFVEPHFSVPRPSRTSEWSASAPRFVASPGSQPWLLLPLVVPGREDRHPEHRLRGAPGSSAGEAGSSGPTAGRFERQSYRGCAFNDAACHLGPCAAFPHSAVVLFSPPFPLENPVIYHGQCSLTRVASCRTDARALGASSRGRGNMSSGCSHGSHGSRSDNGGRDRSRSHGRAHGSGQSPWQRQ